MNDANALLVAIAAQPEEDTPRLIYADCIEEQGEPERAEFIRVQHELARPDREDWRYKYNAGTLPKDHPVAKRLHRTGLTDEMVKTLETYNTKLLALHSREAALLKQHEARWRAGPKCEWCKGLKLYLGSPCQRCHGTGDAGGLLREFAYPNRTVASEPTYDTYEPVRVSYHRGFITRVTVPAMADVVEERAYCAVCEKRAGQDRHQRIDRHGYCARCDATCSAAMTVRKLAPTDWACAVLTATPERACIEELVPLCREPMEEPIGSGRWAFVRGPINHPAAIPEPIWVLAHPDGPHPTRELAISAMGRAVAKFVRGNAGSRPGV